MHICNIISSFGISILYLFDSISDYSIISYIDNWTPNSGEPIFFIVSVCASYIILLLNLLNVCLSLRSSESIEDKSENTYKFISLILTFLTCSCGFGSGLTLSNINCWATIPYGVDEDNEKNCMNISYAPIYILVTIPMVVYISLHIYNYNLLKPDVKLNIVMLIMCLRLSIELVSQVLQVIALEDLYMSVKECNKGGFVFNENTKQLEDCVNNERNINTTMIGSYNLIAGLTIRILLTEIMVRLMSREYILFCSTYVSRKELGITDNEKITYDTLLKNKKYSVEVN